MLVTLVIGWICIVYVTSFWRWMFDDVELVVQRRALGSVFCIWILGRFVFALLRFVYSDCGFSKFDDWSLLV